MLLSNVSPETHFIFDNVQYFKRDNKVITNELYDGFMCKRTKDNIYVVLPRNTNVYMKSHFGVISDGTVFVHDKGTFVKCTLPCGTSVGVNILGQIIINSTDHVFCL